MLGLGEIFAHNSIQLKKKLVKEQKPKVELLKLGEVPSYWHDLEWKLKNDGLFIAELPRGHKLFQKIQEYLTDSLKLSPYSPRKQDKTRMKRAQEFKDNAEKVLNNPDSTELDKERAQLQIEKANLRLNEGENGGAELISSGPIEITRISVILNPDIWNKYLDGKARVSTDLERIQESDPLMEVKWTTPKVMIEDKSCGEVMLIHGAPLHIAEAIVESGFRTEFCRNKGTPEKPKYGLMGKGMYFGDSMSKAMIHSNCPQCGDFHPKSCTPGSNYRPEFTTILARSILGRPKKKMSSLLYPNDDIRSHDCDTIEEHRHSVYSMGLNVSWNLFQVSSHYNEFLVKKDDQMYPEFLIHWRLK